MSYVNSSWRDGMQRAALAIDDKFGESLVIVKCDARANFQAQPIGESFAVRGVFSYRAKLVMEGALPIESREPIASFSTEALPCSLRHKDRVQRDDGTIFEIKAVEPDGVSRTVCKLIQLGLPPNRS